MEVNETGGGTGGAAALAPAPAPAAPAANAGGMFDDVAFSDPGDAGAPTDQRPQLDPPITDGITSPAAVAAAPAPGEPGKPAAPAPAPGTPAVPAPPKLWAGQFGKPEDLEVAYTHSSKEGRRLRGLLTEAEEHLANQKARMAELQGELEGKNIPFKELSNEELNSLNPAAQVTYALDKRAHDEAVVKAKSDAKAKFEATTRQAKETEDIVTNTCKRMLKDESNFPHYGELIPVMDEILDTVPGLRGHKFTPQVAYFAALGYMEAQKMRAGQQASAESAAEAARKAAADAARVGAVSSGAPGTGLPAGMGSASPEPDSDAAHNAALIRAGRRRDPFSGV